jgi:hypothetical protein
MMDGWYDTHPANENRMSCTVQEFGAPRQVRNIKPEVSPSGITGGELIQPACVVQ